MTTRNYSSSATTTSLSGPINDSQTTMPVVATTGFPAAPFILAIDPGAVGQELVLVTGVASLTLTITRGYDSTSALAHTAGAVVQHSHAAIDFRDAATHAAATSGVHGVTGSFVGTTDAQTLTNKTIGNTNTVNGFTASKIMVSDGAGKLTAGTVGSTAVVSLTDTQALTNKDLSSGTNTFPSALATDAEVTSAVSTHNAVTTAHGATGAVVGTTNTQTLTNKTLTAPAISSPVITGAGEVQRVIKASDESVSVNASLQNDDELKFTAAAGGSYLFDILGLCNAGSSAVDIRVGFSFPTGTMSFGVIGLDPAVSSGNTGNVQADGAVGATSGTTSVAAGVSSGGGTPVLVRGSFLCTNAGTVNFQWAQANASGTAMLVKAGSTLRAERVS